MHAATEPDPHDTGMPSWRRGSQSFAASQDPQVVWEVRDQVWRCDQGRADIRSAVRPVQRALGNPLRFLELLQLLAGHASYEGTVLQGAEHAASGKVCRQVEGAEARMLLGGVLATKGQYTKAGHLYGQAMKALRCHLPADGPLLLQLEKQMIGLLHTQRDGKTC